MLAAMAGVPDPIPAIMAGPRQRRRAWLGSRTGIAGLVVLLALSLLCIASIPYTFGSERPSDPPRYRDGSLTGYLLPPFWARMTADERTRYDALNAERASQGRSPARPLLGTDKLGRDLFARCLAGGAISIGIGVAAAALSVVIGVLWGAIAGYFGGRLDALLMRIVDVLYGLPYVLLVVLLAVAGDTLIDSWARRHPERDLSDAARSTLDVLILLVAIGGVSWLTMSRVIRGQVLSLKAQPFMEAARAMGIPVRRQLTAHLLPNLVAPIIVYATLTIPQAILQESFLSFLGIGIKPPLPSWGNLAAEGLGELNPVRIRWWLIVCPCALLGTTLVALNMVGEALREAFDPKRSRR